MCVVRKTEKYKNEKENTGKLNQRWRKIKKVSESCEEKEKEYRWK